MVKKLDLDIHQVSRYPTNFRAVPGVCWLWIPQRTGGLKTNHMWRIGRWDSDTRLSQDRHQREAGVRTAHVGGGSFSWTLSRSSFWLILNWQKAFPMTTSSHKNASLLNDEESKDPGAEARDEWVCSRRGNAMNVRWSYYGNRGITWISREQINN